MSNKNPTHLELVEETQRRQAMVAQHNYLRLIQAGNREYMRYFDSALESIIKLTTQPK